MLILIVGFLCQGFFFKRASPLFQLYLGALLTENEKLYTSFPVLRFYNFLHYGIFKLKV